MSGIETGREADGQVRRKDGYHHGELREALVQATRRLVVERGAENFTLADACRLAGVSTAAPYRHFRDKQEILAEIAHRGFDEMHFASMAAVAAAGEGTLDGIVAMGLAYVDFAVRETAIFRLMFGQDPALKQETEVMESGQSCFTGVIGQVEIYCRRNGLETDARLLAVELWTLVHGAASLLIDGDYDKVVPGLDVPAMIRGVTRRVLSA